jgi:trk system potassium uptake protein TrkH
MFRRPLSPPQLLASGMAGVILIGTLLLAAPVASASGASVGWSAALFTATSAVCVTGLVVVDTPTAFSGFGQGVLLLLIQVGGLGYMTLSTLVVMALGRRVSMTEQHSLQESLNLSSRNDILRFAMTVIKVTVAFELVGAAILAVRWWGGFGVDALWLALFHSVSAFNNAGFSLFSNSLMDWRGDVVVNLTIMTLIVSGGIGYLVLTELGRYRYPGTGSERTGSLSLHTRFVLTLTVVLIAAGTVAILITERSNPATLGPMGWPAAILAAAFQSVTTRTAGFNTLDMAALRPATYFLMLILMFIGGAPGGTAGGVKISTFGVTVLALWATIRGRREPTVFWRRLPADLVARAFFVSLIAFLAVNVVTGLLLVREGGDLLRTLFEAVSAFGTVGLSTGVTGTGVSLSASFSEGGRLLICLLMFMGRIGPLTLAFALASRRTPSRVRYPEGRVLIG